MVVVPLVQYLQNFTSGTRQWRTLQVEREDLRPLHFTMGVPDYSSEYDQKF